METPQTYAPAENGLRGTQEQDYVSYVKQTTHVLEEICQHNHVLTPLCLLQGARTRQTVYVWQGIPVLTEGLVWGAAKENGRLLTEARSALSV